MRCRPTIDAAYDAGVTIIAAAGNDGDGSIDYPCAFRHVICVGATDNGDGHAPFSNVNAYVDISAPGVSVASTYPPFGCPGYPLCYWQMSGTSMATPRVAGVAALVLSAWPAYTPDQIEAALENTAVDLGTAGRDDLFGYGRVGVRLPPSHLGPSPAPQAALLPRPPTPRRSSPWTAPASDGGSAITGYTATSAPGGKTCTTTGALSCAVSGLTNGTAYTFEVRRDQRRRDGTGLGCLGARHAACRAQPADVGGRHARQRLGARRLDGPCVGRWKRHHRLRRDKLARRQDLQWRRPLLHGERADERHRLHVHGDRDDQRRHRPRLRRPRRPSRRRRAPRTSRSLRPACSTRAPATASAASSWRTTPGRSGSPGAEASRRTPLR